MTTTTSTPREAPDPMLLHVMLTVAAIVQGVAFTEVVQSPEFKMVHVGIGMTFDDWLRGVEVAAAFSIVAVVWFGQIVNCVGYSLWPRAYFGLLDALFPFAFGAIEVRLAQTIGVPDTWCRWLSAFYLLLVLSWWDFYRKLDRRIASNNEWFGARYARFKRLNRASAIVLCLLFLSLSWYTFEPAWTRVLLFGGIVGLAFATAMSLKQVWDERKSTPVADHHLAAPATAGTIAPPMSSETPRGSSSVVGAAGLVGLILGVWFTSRAQSSRDRKKTGATPAADGDRRAQARTPARSS